MAPVGAALLCSAGDCVEGCEFAGSSMGCTGSPPLEHAHAHTPRPASNQVLTL